MAAEECSWSPQGACWELWPQVMVDCAGSALCGEKKQCSARSETKERTRKNQEQTSKNKNVQLIRLNTMIWKLTLCLQVETQVTVRDTPFSEAVRHPARLLRSCPVSNQSHQLSCCCLEMILVYAPDSLL